MTTKKCTTCNIEKTIDSFQKDNRSNQPTGIHCRCRACISIENKISRKRMAIKKLKQGIPVRPLNGVERTIELEYQSINELMMMQGEQMGTRSRIPLPNVLTAKNQYFFGLVGGYDSEESYYESPY